MFMLSTGTITPLWPLYAPAVQESHQDGIVLFFRKALLLGKLRGKQHLKLCHCQLLRLFATHPEVRSRCVDVLESIEFR